VADDGEETGQRQCRGRPDRFPGEPNGKRALDEIAE
jgi:hypothetical protein